MRERLFIETAALLGRVSSRPQSSGGPGVLSVDILIPAGIFAVMANASDDTLASASQTSTPRTLFQSARDGGSDIDGALAVSVLNTGSKDAFIFSKGHHGQSAATTNYIRLPAGASLTIETAGEGDVLTQIGQIVAKTAGSDTTTLSWGVTKRR